MGQGSRSSGLSSVDFYRRVPKDLTEVRMMGGGIDGTKRQLLRNFFLRGPDYEIYGHEKRNCTAPTRLGQGKMPRK